MDEPIIVKREKKSRSGFVNFLKYLLIILNLFILIAGLGSLAVGIWIVVDKRSMEYIVGSNLYTSSAYILIAVGAWMIIMAFVGCFGALKEIKCILITYFVCTLVLFLLMSIAGILGFVFKDHLLQANSSIDSPVKDYLQEAMITSLRTQYGQNRRKSDIWVTEAWDYTQTTFSCCAVTDLNENREDDTASKRDTSGSRKHQPAPIKINETLNFRAWQSSNWFKLQNDYPRERVPRSCCVKCADLWSDGYCAMDDQGEVQDRDPRMIVCETQCPEATDEFVNLNMCQGTSAEALLVWPKDVYLNTKGCYPMLVKEMKISAILLGSVGIGVAILLFVSMVCSVCLYRFLD